LYPGDAQLLKGGLTVPVLLTHTVVAEATAGATAIAAHALAANTASLRAHLGARPWSSRVMLPPLNW
jgi:hypothetical protein